VLAGEANASPAIHVDVVSGPGISTRTLIASSAAA